MTTIHAPHRAFSLFTSPTLLLGFICALTPAFAGADQLIAPATQVNMNEAPPPWQGVPATQSNTSAPAVAQTASGGSSIENWYRNRRKTAANPANEQAALQAAAQQGDAKAQYKLAMQYRKGDSSPANIQQSLEWQQKSAQAGYAEAQYGLGLLYANGQYVAADAQQARNWFQQAAGQGHVAARLALLSLSNGASAQAVAAAPAMEDVRQERVAAAPPPVLRPKAMAPVVDSASYPAPVATKVSLSVPKQDTNAGSVDLTGIEPEVLRQSAEAGDKQAQLMLGTMYEDGLGGLPSDLRDAAYWYEQAAKQGYPKAQYNLGLLYEDGRGVTQNYNQAAYWYEKAATAGFTEAQNNLGVLYVLGNGVDKNAQKAEQLFSEAARGGSSDAQRNLGMLRKS
ncbi:SEL1-like repeat protein [Thiothrix litoralis]|jgi:hypothetical protein|uniref:SEL1-like repeat protein n=2 Tax=Thiothrix litoralis TaxID=2891210 RepID=A0ABX7X2Q2_9GAMM|nr:SEL1-like repeat protein [Thiothrix litoralis]QTR47415.1 SEL1-like repeat protein [Thiothrix litoralis]